MDLVGKNPTGRSTKSSVGKRRQKAKREAAREAGRGSEK